MPVLIRCQVEAHEISMDEAMVGQFTLSEIRAKIDKFIESEFEESHGGEYDLGGNNYVHDEDIESAFSVKEITQEQYDVFVDMFVSNFVGESGGLLHSMLETEVDE